MAAPFAASSSTSAAIRCTASSDRSASRDQRATSRTWSRRATHRQTEEATPRGRGTAHRILGRLRQSARRRGRPANTWGMARRTSERGKRSGEDGAKGAAAYLLPRFAVARRAEGGVGARSRVDVEERVARRLEQRDERVPLRFERPLALADALVAARPSSPCAALRRRRAARRSAANGRRKARARARTRRTRRAPRTGAPWTPSSRNECTECFAAVDVDAQVCSYETLAS